LSEFIALQKKKSESAKSWTINARDIESETYDLSVKNPNEPETAAHRTPKVILEEIAALDAESAEVLESIRAML
jgi:type I restriction enzyme M protein